jgi:acyl-CoA synthetase (AMP-forming)/AMP-acid ligase II
MFTHTSVFAMVMGNMFLQVSPSELESILVLHPGIQDAAVIGIEDETFGELPGAFVVRDRDTLITADDIKHYVACKYSVLQMTADFFAFFYICHDNMYKLIDTIL